MGNRCVCWVLAVATMALPCRLYAQETAHGWRGNGTGLWTDASAPLTWQRLAKGAMEGLRAQADQPKGGDAGDAPLVEKGLIRDWLVLGPFVVADAVKDFDRDLLAGEADVKPDRGEKAAGKVWQPVTTPFDDPTVFGTAELPWLDFVKAVGFEPNQFAYAHTYLFSKRGGPARIVVDHGEGLKAWVNGKVVYRSPARGMGLGYYTALGRIELSHRHQPSPRFDFELKPGWNRLLLKLSSARKDSYKDMRCALRIMDPPSVPYEEKSIVWKAELPGRSTATPIQVGDKLFVMAEPDELLCLDKRTGRILWRASNNIYDALPDADRKAKPDYAKRVDPLVAQLRKETDPVKRIELRGKISETLKQIDAARFTLPVNDHMETHFGIVGFTMPTPVSDGRHVYVWCNMGVAACYDLDGKRRWIRRLPGDSIAYGASPALADGVLAVFLGELYGLDAATGETRWKQFRVKYCIAAVQATRLNGQPVFITQRSEILRPADGAILYRPRESGDSADSGWAPPVIIGNRLYAPKFGVGLINILDFSAAAGDKLAPSLDRIELPSEIHRGPKGAWIDRWTAGSPVVWQGLIYQIDMYGWLYVADLKSKRMLYRKLLDLRGLMHANAIPVAASPTLIGKNLVVLDNQGTAIVIEPGPEYKQLAVNRIETQLDRDWPIPAQETLAYAPPLADGNRLYLRGEKYLYCIGEK